MSSVAKGQLGFIQFVIAPIYTELAAVVPEVLPALRQRFPERLPERLLCLHHLAPRGLRGRGQKGAWDLWFF